MILEDENKIMEILSLPECADLLDGLPAMIVPGVTHLYFDGCLFPSVIKSDHISVHAAIPKGKRGKIAVRAGRKCFTWIVRNLGLNPVCRIYKHRRHAKMYARMVGLALISSDDKYDYFGVNCE